MTDAYRELRVVRLGVLAQMADIAELRNRAPHMYGHCQNEGCSRYLSPDLVNVCDDCCIAFEKCPPSIDFFPFCWFDGS